MPAGLISNIEILPLPKPLPDKVHPTCRPVVLLSSTRYSGGLKLICSPEGIGSVGKLLITTRLVPGVEDTVVPGAIPSASTAHPLPMSALLLTNIVVDVVGVVAVVTA